MEQEELVSSKPDSNFTAAEDNGMIQDFSLTSHGHLEKCKELKLERKLFDETVCLSSPISKDSSIKFSAYLIPTAPQEDFYGINMDEESLTPVKDKKIVREKVNEQEEGRADISRIEESNQVEASTIATQSSPSPLSISTAFCCGGNEETTNEQVESATTTPQSPPPTSPQPSTSNLTAFCWRENEENTNEQVESATTTSQSPPQTSTQPSTSNLFSLPPLDESKVTDDVESSKFESKIQSPVSTPLSPIPEASNQHDPMDSNGSSDHQQTIVDKFKESTQVEDYSPRRSARMKKINKKIQTPKQRQTPMGLPKPNRLKKNEFSVQEIYMNKNYHTPKPKAWETIYEEPKLDKKGEVRFTEKRLRRRAIDFYTVPAQRPAKKRGRECSRELRKKANERKKRRMEFGISDDMLRDRLENISDDDDDDENPLLLS